MPFALVTGASRGVGRGVVIGLAAAGYSVAATGRSIETADLPSGVLRIPCDHYRDDDTIAAVDRAQAKFGELDVLVNSSWGGYEHMIEDGKFTWAAPFWEQPIFRWGAMMDAGTRSAFVASRQAAPGMIARRSGLIVNISHWAAQRHIANVIYGVSKAATDKLTADMAHELREHQVAVVSLYPGMVRTELVMQAAQWLDLSNSESPEFQGQVIAALAADEKRMKRTGQTLVTAQLALEYGVDDDGRQPHPLTLETCV
jgi:NAD(P)-dependent dehydrogenase (short-subunit alcohol dehydrogenase family)